MIRYTTAVNVVEPTDAAEARRMANVLAAELRLGETTIGKVALVATELATNLVKHGGGGFLLFGSDDEARSALHIVCADKGRGIANIPSAMRDGYSTAGSPGTGLGAVSRMASHIDIYSAPEKGTIIACAVAEPDEGPASKVRHRLEVAGICLPKTGEHVAGDDWDGNRAGDTLTLLVSDGLGHGEAAATASAAAVRALRESAAASSIEEILHVAHRALRGTRGAAVAVARISPPPRALEFAGVGNIAGTIVGDNGVRKMVSHNGIVGHEMRKVQTFSYPWLDSSILLMHSDGIGGSWTMEAYPGLHGRSAPIIATAIYRDHCRRTDDATVVVVKPA